MKVYVDTNVLIAASVQAHPHHARAFKLVSSVKDGVVQGCISTHGLAEFYAVLTRAPFSPRVHPAEASRFLEDNITPHFELVTLSADDYKRVLSGSAKAGLVGGLCMAPCIWRVPARRNVIASIPSIPKTSEPLPPPTS